MKDKYKTFEELKEELGDKFDLYMYQINLDLMRRLDKVVELADTMNHSDWIIYGRDIIKTTCGAYFDYEHGEEHE